MFSACKVCESELFTGTLLVTLCDLVMDARFRVVSIYLKVGTVSMEGVSNYLAMGTSNLLDNYLAMGTAHTFQR